MTNNVRGHINAALDALLPSSVMAALGAPGWVIGGWYATLFVAFLRQNRSTAGDK